MNRRLFILAICAAFLFAVGIARADSITYHVNGTLDYKGTGSDPLSLDGASYNLAMTFDTADNDGSGFYSSTASTLTLNATPYAGTSGFGIIDSTSFFLTDVFFPAAATPLSVEHTIEFGAGFLNPPNLPYYNTGDVSDISSSLYYVADVQGNPSAEFSFDIVDAESYSVPPRQDGPSPIPEPTTIACFGLGLIGLGVFRSRKKVRR